MAALTIKQQKRTIANRIATGKPLLCSPDSNYWPLLDPRRTQEFVDAFEKSLKDISFTKESFLKTTQQSKKARDAITIPDQVRKHFKIGVNSSIRSLQSHATQCLMISSDTSPRLLAKQIINMALNRNPAITIIVVPTMSDIFKSIFGITCCVCACEEVSPDFRKFMQEATNTFEKPKQFQLKTSDQVETKAEKIKTKIQPVIDFEKIYLKRPSNGGRAFTPNSKNVKTDTQENKTVWNDYITFNDADESSDTKMDTDECSDKEKIESTVIQLKDLNLPSIVQPTLEPKKKKKRKKMKNSTATDVVKYTPTVAKKVYGNPLKKKKNKKNKTSV